MKAIECFPPAVTKKELMWGGGYEWLVIIRSFCPNLFTVMAPMTDLLKSLVKYNWMEKCDQAFQNVKMLLTTALGWSSALSAI